MSLEPQPHLSCLAYDVLSTVMALDDSRANKAPGQSLWGERLESLGFYPCLPPPPTPLLASVLVLGACRLVRKQEGPNDVYCGYVCL